MMRVKLKDLGVISTGNTPSKNVPEFYDSNDIGFVKPDIISDSQIDYIDVTQEYLSNSARNKARIVKKNTVFVTCIGSIGKVGIAQSNELAFNQQINAIAPNEKVVSKYLAYCIFANKKRLQTIANAPVVPIINKSQFGDFEIEIASEMEQQEKIVKILDAVDKIIKLHKQQLAKLDELVKARFVEMFGDPETNPKGFKKVLLSDIAEYFNGLTYSPDNVNNDGTIVLRSSNIQNSQLDFADTVRVDCPIKEKLYVKNNDILMCSRNGSARLVGKVALINNLSEPMTFGAFMMIIRSKYYSYLMTYFQMDAFRRQIAIGATTTINQITGNMLNKISLPVPAMADINEFATFVEQVDKSKVAVQKALDEAQTLFDSLMQQYFG